MGALQVRRRRTLTGGLGPRGARAARVLGNPRMACRALDPLPHLRCPPRSTPALYHPRHARHARAAGQPGHRAAVGAHRGDGAAAGARRAAPLASPPPPRRRRHASPCCCACARPRPRETRRRGCWHHADLPVCALLLPCCPCTPPRPRRPTTSTSAPPRSSSLARRACSCSPRVRRRARAAFRPPCGCASPRLPRRARLPRLLLAPSSVGLLPTCSPLPPLHALCPAEAAMELMLRRTQDFMPQLRTGDVAVRAARSLPGHPAACAPAGLGRAVAGSLASAISRRMHP